MRFGWMAALLWAGALALAGCGTTPVTTTPGVDGGEETGDGGTPLEDGSVQVTTDAGPRADDAATEPPDAGEPPDAAEPGLDAGPVPDASPCTGAYPPYTGPDDSYTSLEDKRDGALKSALQAKIKAGHDKVSYDSAKGILFGKSGIDVHGGKVECIYSGDLFSPNDLDSTGGYNTEHSWPQSDFGPEATTAKGDMHHLFPTERNINSCRNSYPFGQTVAPQANCSRGGSERGPRWGGAATDIVFTVRQKFRGDVARAHFYFSTRYGMTIPANEEAALRCWHEEDPPDAEEKTRNAAIAAKQGNWNPFVERPEFVGYISDF